MFRSVILIALIVSHQLVLIVQARYVQYEAFTSSNCEASSSIAKGIAAPEGLCVPFITATYLSRKYTCSGVINYPVDQTCTGTPVPSMPNLDISTTGLGGCTLSEGVNITGVTTYVRYSCALGGTAEGIVSPFGNCSTILEPGSIASATVTFYTVAGCTTGFDPSTESSLGSSTFATANSNSTITTSKW